MRAYCRIDRDRGKAGRAYQRRCECIPGTGPRSCCRDRISSSQRRSQSSRRIWAGRARFVDLAKLAANAVPTTKYRRVCDLDQYCQAQDQWLELQPGRTHRASVHQLLPSHLAGNDCEIIVSEALFLGFYFRLDRRISMLCGVWLCPQSQNSAKRGILGFLSRTRLPAPRHREEGTCDVTDARVMLAPEMAHHPLAAITGSADPCALTV